MVQFLMEVRDFQFGLQVDIIFNVRSNAVLGSLEPFLIDIANLPDKAPPSEVRQIKDRVQRTEIVAELRSY